MLNRFTYYPCRLLGLAILVALMIGCQTGQTGLDSVGEGISTDGTEAAELEAQQAREAELLQQQIEAARLEAARKALDERYQQAIEALKNEKFAVAESLLSDLESQADLLPLLITNLGLAQLAQKNWISAEQTFKRAIAKTPDNAIAHNHLAVAQREQGKFTEALASYQEALTINPDYKAAHLNLAILFDIYLQQLPDAREHYETYLELHGEEDKLVTGWLTDLNRRLGNQ